MTRRISIAKAKARFAEVVRRAEAGETMILTRHGRPVARLAPTSGNQERLATATEVHEPRMPYDAARAGREGTLLPRSEADRREAIERFLRESIWPRVPAEQLGVGVDRREREDLLGYGSDGV